MRRVVRAAAVVAAIISLFVWAHAIASASEVEYCPARVIVENVGTATPEPSASPQPATMFAIRLDAASARSVQGVVGFDTTGGWYQVAVPDIPLLAVESRWSDDAVEFKRHEFLSDPIYVSFPKPVTIASAFMISATTQGESVFGWDAKGTVTCAAPSDRLNTPQKYPNAGGDRETLDVLTVDRSAGTQSGTTESLRRLSPKLDIEPPPSGAGSVHATIPAAVPDASCRAPFAPAKVKELLQPPYPDILGREDIPFAEVLIAVAVSATGKVDAAWVFAPSGFTAIDESALHGARGSTYEPARSFCQDAPGTYLFKADFVR